MQLIESKVALLNLSSGSSNEDHVGQDQGHRISTRMDVSLPCTCAPVSLYTPVSLSVPVSVSWSVCVLVFRSSIFSRMSGVVGGMAGIGGTC